MRTSLPPFRTLVRYGAISLVILMLGTYTIWQARLLLIGPVLTFDVQPPTISSEPTIELAGTAANIVKITLNGRAIYTDQDGRFNETVVLENGYSVSTIVGTDRYGRSNAISHGVVYTPDTK